MTLRWRICFSLALTAAVGTAAGTVWGATLTGTVMLRDSRLDAVNRQHDYSGVVVSAQPMGGPPAAASSSTARHVTMLQKNKTFTPHVLPVEAGSTVDFPNADPIFHNAFSSYSGQIFDVGLYAPGSSRSVRFVRPGVVRVFCNIHPAMSAIILVLGTPYFATTAKDGSFTMNVPAGEYDLSIFHERATEASLAELSRRILVAEPSAQIPPVVVSEAGYLLAPHKNKYGKEYPPAPGDQPLYPSVRN